MARKASEDGTSGGKNQQVPLTAQEQANLERLVALYQKAVVTRNDKTNETQSANVERPEIMRAGLAALEDLSPEKLRLLVVKIRDGRQAGADS
jgi:hypothetical protein